MATERGDPATTVSLAVDCAPFSEGAIPLSKKSISLHSTFQVLPVTSNPVWLVFDPSTGVLIPMPNGVGNNGVEALTISREPTPFWLPSLSIDCPSLALSVIWVRSSSTDPSLFLQKSNK